MRRTSVTFRGEEVDVMYRDHGYEPDTNAHDIDWEFVEEPDPPATDEEEQAIYLELAQRETEHDDPRWEN